jgi:hypothetical protein
MPDPSEQKQDASAGTSGPASDSGQMPSQAEARNERDLLRIAAYSTALAFGAMFGTIQSYHRDASGFSFQISCWTLAAALIGAVVGFFYWKLVAFSARRDASLLFRGASFLLLLAVVGALLSPLRFLSAETLNDVTQGLVVGVVALSLLGFILWRIRGFLNRDSSQGAVASEAPMTSPVNPPVAESDRPPADKG